jgi:hypothetical protein
VTRVFSPFNETYAIRASYDFMIVISGDEEVDEAELEKIKSIIVPEFKTFLINTTVGSFFFIALITAILMLYAWIRISRPITKLTKWVQDPSSNKPTGEKGDEKKMNEI